MPRTVSSMVCSNPTIIGPLNRNLLPIQHLCWTAGNDSSGCVELDSIRKKAEGRIGTVQTGRFGTNGIDGVIDQYSLTRIGSVEAA